MEFAELGDLCARIDKAHNRTDYRERFGWLDNFKPVADRELRLAREKHVIGTLQRGELDGLDLSPPEIVEWDRVESFRYHFGQRHHSVDSDRIGH